MFEVLQTVAYRRWFDGLRDIKAKARIARRIERAEAGNLGDVKPIGEGVSEMRVDFGPGYRIYFARRGSAIVILLCGGDKQSQRRDVRTAIQMAKELRE